MRPLANRQRGTEIDPRVERSKRREKVSRALARRARSRLCGIFDEVQSREHEPKAFDEFLSETEWNFHLVAANRGLSGALFRRMPDA